VWRIQLGIGPRWGTLRIGRTLIELRRRVLLGFVIYEPAPKTCGTLREIAVLLSGLLANGLLIGACGGGFLYLRETNPDSIWLRFIAGFAAANLIMLAANLWPRVLLHTTPPLQTDGANLWRLLKLLGRNRTHEIKQAGYGIRVFEHLNRGEDREALDVIQSARRDASPHLSFDVNETVALIRLGRFEEAFETGNTLLRQDILDKSLVPLVQNNTAWAGLLTRRDDLLTTVEAYSSEVLQTATPHPAFLGTRGAYEIATGHIAQGQTHIEQSMHNDEDGTYREIHLAWLAVAASINHDPQRSAEYQQTALRLRPQSPEVQSILARLPKP